MLERDGRVDCAEPSDKRNGRMPDREGISGVEPSVAELVDDVERAQVERLELTDAPEMEETVAVDRVCRPPDGTGEHRAAEGDTTEGHLLCSLRGHGSPEDSRNKRSRGKAGEQPERRVDGAVEGESQRERAGERGEAPCKRGCDRDAEGGRASERPDEDSAGDEEHARSRRRQPEHETRPMRGQEPAQPQRRGCRCDEKQEERGRAHPAEAGAIDPHLRAHDSHCSASSASVPAWTQTPPRARTSSMKRRYKRPQPGVTAESNCSECQRTAKPPPFFAAQSRRPRSLASACRALRLR